MQRQELGIARSPERALEALDAVDLGLVRRSVLVPGRVGGRTSSEAGWLDLGATWFWDGQAAIAEVVEASGVATYPQVLDGDALLEQPTGDAARLDGNPIDRPGWRVVGGMEHGRRLLQHPDDPREPPVHEGGHREHAGRRPLYRDAFALLGFKKTATFEELRRRLEVGWLDAVLAVLSESALPSIPSRRGTARDPLALTPARRP